MNKDLLREYLEQVIIENSNRIPGQFVEGDKVFYRASSLEKEIPGVVLYIIQNDEHDKKRYLGLDGVEYAVLLPRQDDIKRRIVMAAHYQLKAQS